MGRKKLYEKNSTKTFKISRSKIDLYLKCKRCFYLDQKLGITPPSGPQFSLNMAVDALLKKEFDFHRQEKTKHPFQIENKIDAIPFHHKDIDEWRNNKRGIQYLHTPTNFLIYGSIDDIWINSNGELIIIDYKAKATKDDPNTYLEPKTDKIGNIDPNQYYKIGYKKQIEIYQWLFIKNNFKVSNQAFFIFANALKTLDGFNNNLIFEKHLISYEGNYDWVEPVLFEILDCLNDNIPPEQSNTCKHCQYLKAGSLI